MSIREDEKIAPHCEFIHVHDKVVKQVMDVMPEGEELQNLAEFFRIGPLQFDHLPTLFFGEAGKGPPDRERCPALFFRFQRRRRRRHILRFFRSRRNQSGAAERD